MAISVVHLTSVSVPDDGTSPVGSDEWNEPHVVTGTLDVSQGGTGQTTEAEAVGELIQALSEDTNPDFQTDFIGSYDASADTGKKIALSTITRDFLQADRDYYVRTAPTTVTMTIDSPAVVTWATHGLAVNDPVVFHLPRNAGTCTITIATPGVVSKTGHGLAAGDPIKFRSTGALPTGITGGTTTYYVIAAGLTADAFQFSTSSGGSAVDTSGSQSGTHYLERASSMPTGAKPGYIYYVLTIPTTSTFTFSDSEGGAAINTSGSQAGKLQAQTGNDSNDGASFTYGHALLTAQRGIDLWQELDPRRFKTKIRLSPGDYENIGVTRNPPLGAGGTSRDNFNPMSILGSGDYANALGDVETLVHAQPNLQASNSQQCIDAGGTECRVRVEDLTLAADFAIAPDGLPPAQVGAYGLGGAGAALTRVFRCTFDGTGVIAPTEVAFAISAYQSHEMTIEDVKILGDWQVFMDANYGSLLTVAQNQLPTAVTFIGQPNFSLECLLARNGSSIVDTYGNPTGTCTGKKYSAREFSLVQTVDADFPGSTAGTAISYSRVKTASTDVTYGTDTTQTTGVPVALSGKQTIWIPAASLTPRTTAGITVSSREINSITVGTGQFADGSDSGANFHVGFPKSWNASTVTYQVAWTAASGSGTVEFELRGGCFANDAAINASGLGTAVAVADTLITAGDVHWTSESAAVTLSNDDDNTLAIFEIIRDVSDDTLNATAELLGIKFFYTTDAGNDA